MLDVASKGDYHLLTLLRVQFHIVGSSSFCSMETSLVGTISDSFVVYVLPVTGTRGYYFQIVDHYDKKD